ncbi:uncharacterized protein C8A04DRAFT_39802 [Dichotomopilus funicola]|uniref:Glycosyl transferase family 25 domain-containing protein n=1 Tax=Dichotomopilus funicola TaxID=1934379 RepID=A0AAN6UWQ2_9PEZI|nr:hypothetical protein C8A04DRAFT_39802 [Dichotomopilus funicola]
MFARHRIVAVLVALCVAFFIWAPTPGWLPARDTLSPRILNSTLGFQHIFAINLPERTDRRDAMVLAAALSELDVTLMDGVMGRDVPDKVLPGDPESREGRFNKGNKGSWRAHMDVLQRIVRENITSALILEDDADWDVRIKAQMQVFAQASRIFTQPNPSTHQPAADDPNLFLGNPQSSSSSPSLPLTNLPRNLIPHPHLTPYGDDWDVLWLGHCGTDFPGPSINPSFPGSPLRVTIADDPTVPSAAHLKPHPFALQDALADVYPAHTRVVHAASGTACTQAYAVSQQGARKLLWQFGLQTLTTGWDLMLRDWCDGFYPASEGAREDDFEDDAAGEQGRKHPMCVTVQPPLFSHHYGRGAASDIMAPGGGFVNREKEMTPYVRQSVRLNMERLVRGLAPREQWGEKSGE